MDIDVSSVLLNMKRIDNLSSIVDTMVNDIIQCVCGDLDEYMKTVDSLLCDSGNITDVELEQITLNIPSLLYGVSLNRERLGVKEDMAKAVYKEVYSQARQMSTGTVADKDTAAELASKSESISLTVYNRAVRLIKSKEEYALEMLASVKKVLSRRISEMELSNQVRS